MRLQIKVYSDYICPYCYLAEVPLQQAIAGKDIEIERLPFELRPAPQVTLRPEEDYLQKTWLLSVYPAARRLGVPIVLPRISPQPHTELAFEGFQFAKRHGKGNEYHLRVLNAFFQEEQDIGKPNVLCRLAGEIGLDEKGFRQALDSRQFREIHQAELRHARLSLGISSVPTFLVGSQKLVGWQAKVALERAIERALGRQKETTPLAPPPRLHSEPTA